MLVKAILIDSLGVDLVVQSSEEIWRISIFLILKVVDGEICLLVLSLNHFNSIFNFHDLRVFI